MGRGRAALAYNPSPMPPTLQPSLSSPDRTPPAPAPSPPPRRAAGPLIPGLLLPLLLLGLGLALRLHGLDRYIASDELRWTCRSLNFHQALLEGRPSETFQVGHPGVMTMWLGTAAAGFSPLGQLPALCRDTAGGTDFDRLDDRGQEGRMQGFAAPLFGLRRGMALGTLLLYGLICLLLSRGLRWPRPAVLGALLLAVTDPFQVAHGRVLHVDAPVALLSLAAVLALAAALRQDASPRPWWSALAGALAGAAALAKSSALVLGPFAVLVHLGWAWRNRAGAAAQAGAAVHGPGTTPWSAALRACATWILAAVLTYGALWPAMWVDPMGTLFRGCTAAEEEAGCRPGVLAKAAEEGGQPHQSGNYFRGRPVADPGPAFYPLALLFRLTPLATLVLLAFLARAARARARRPRQAATPGRRSAVLPGQGLILAWALLFVLVIGLGPKKFDRYALPAQAALTLLAGAWAGVWATGWIARIGRRGLRPAGGARPASEGAALLLLLGLQAMGWRAAGPDGLSYPLMVYNPLLGGAPAAAGQILVGWGEGYDLAAAWLNQRPQAAEEQVAVRGLANFAPLYRGATRSTAGYEPGRTDFIVFYRSEVQRRHPDSEPLLALLQDPPDARPLFVGSIEGLPMVWVHANPTVAPLEAAIAARAGADDLLVAGGETVFARHYQGPRTLLRYWGHQDRAALEQELLPRLPGNWRRAWVIRYPGNDPEAVLDALGGLARRGETHTIGFADGSSVQLTPFDHLP